jgi:hypothetical protein
LEKAVNEAMQALVEGVKKHAIKHYEDGGWDYVVETMDDEDIADLIGFARNITEAIRNVGNEVHLLHERREDIREGW